MENLLKYLFFKKRFNKNSYQTWKEKGIGAVCTHCVVATHV
jgi:hypothetical protein